MSEEKKKSIEELQEEWRLKRFYEILLEADLKAFHDMMEERKGTSESSPIHQSIDPPAG